MILKKKFSRAKTQCSKSHAVRSDDPKIVCISVQVWRKNVCTVHHARGIFTASPNASVHNLQKDS